MRRPVKYVEKALTTAAGTAFDVIQYFNNFKPNPSFTPKWSDKPLLKSWQKSKPPLGWPRTTDSLCPKCVARRARKSSSGEQDYRILINEKVGRDQGHRFSSGTAKSGWSRNVPTHGKIRRHDGHG